MLPTTSQEPDRVHYALCGKMRFRRFFNQKLYFGHLTSGVNKPVDLTNRAHLRASQKRKPTIFTCLVATSADGASYVRTYVFDTSADNRLYSRTLLRRRPTLFACVPETKSIQPTYEKLPVTGLEMRGQFDEQYKI